MCDFWYQERIHPLLLVPILSAADPNSSGQYGVDRSLHNRVLRIGWKRV